MALVACVNLALGAMAHTCQAVALINNNNQQQQHKLPDGDAVISSSELLTTNSTSTDRVVLFASQHQLHNGEKVDSGTPEVGGGDDGQDGSEAQTSRLLLQLLVLGLFVLVSSSLIIIYALKFCLCRGRKAQRRLLARRARLIGDLSAGPQAEMLPALPPVIVNGLQSQQQQQLVAQQFENFLLAECTCHLAGPQVPPPPAPPPLPADEEAETNEPSLVLSLLARLQHSICASMHHHHHHQTAPLAPAVQPLTLPIEHHHHHHHQQQQQHQLAQLLVAQLMAAAAACQSCGTCHEQWLPTSQQPTSRPPSYADLFRPPAPSASPGEHGDNTHDDDDDDGESH